VAKFQTKCFLDQRPLVLPDDASVEYTPVDIEFPATAPGTGDLIELCKIPPGNKVTDWAIVWPDIDSNGTPLCAFSLGVENAGGTDLGSEVWVTGLQGGRTGAVDRNATSAAYLGDSTVERAIALKCTAAAATYDGATKKGVLLLALQG